MSRTITVVLGDEARPLARLHHDARGQRESVAFEYDPSWLEALGRFAIDPTLPLTGGRQFRTKPKEGSVFHAAIADTEPDGWGRRVILRDHAKRRKTQRAQAALPLSSLDFLLAVDDQSRVGALRFQDESGVFQRQNEPGSRTAPPLIDLGHLVAATRAVESNKESAADLAYLRGRGTSLGGLRPKCTIVDERGQLSIGKFPSIHDERAVTKGEVLALRLATKAGIRAAQARLIESDGIPVALIRRFDRPPKGGRLMYVSAATLLGAESTDAHVHTYGELVDVLRIHSADPRADIDELWRRIAFSILITNVDDHLRNHGFLHVEKDKWRLSPAFDINPFPERVRELKTWMSEETGPEATVENLLSTAKYFRITRTRAVEILGEVERAVARWRGEGRALGMTAVELDSFAEAFEHSERAAARRASD